MFVDKVPGHKHTGELIFLHFFKDRLHFFVLFLFGLMPDMPLKNIFFIKVTPSLTTPASTFRPIRKKMPSKSSSDKRSNMETNMLNVWPGFEVVRINHAFQMADLFSLEEKTCWPCSPIRI